MVIGNGNNPSFNGRICGSNLAIHTSIINIGQPGVMVVNQLILPDLIFRKGWSMFEIGTSIYIQFLSIVMGIYIVYNIVLNSGNTTLSIPDRSSLIIIS
jgi:hypothetical protein